jgi:N-methylhydantoinase B
VAGDLKGGGNPLLRRRPRSPDRETFIFYEYPGGGTGGFDGGDGSNTVRAWTESDMTTLQPIEAIEQLYPVRVEETSLREDSAGRPLARRPRAHARGADPARDTRLSVLAEKPCCRPSACAAAAPGATTHFVPDA